MTAVFDLLASAWVPVFLLLGLTLYLRSRVRSWLVPSAFFGLLWVCFLAASLLAVDHRVPGLGTWVLAALIAAVQIGSMLGEFRLPELEKENKRQPTSTAWSERSAIEKRTRTRALHASTLLTLAAMGGLTYFAWYSLELFQQPVSLVSLIQMAAKWTILRYDGFLDPWPLRLAAIWVYPAALVGGILFPLSKNFRDRSTAALSLLPSLLLTALSGGRAAFLVALVCWLAGYLSVRAACVEAPVRLLSLKSALGLGFGALGLLLLYLGVNSLRGARETTEADQLSMEFNSGQVRNYMFGMPAAFAEWFDRDDHSSIQWGGLTFPGPYSLLGIRPRTLGTYLDSASTVGSEGTNIFTMFRGLTEDFTLGGAFVFCGLWGFLGGYSYSRHSLRTGTVLALSGYYATALFSPLLCLFAFNSSTFAWLVAWVVLRSQKGNPTDSW